MMTDDHEYIIRMPDPECVPDFGLGYEIFHRMKLRLGEISEFIADTNTSVTFSERLDAYTRVAINLKKLNFSNDDIIAICARNHEQTSMPFIAGLFNGNIVTCVDPFLVTREKAMIFVKITPKILFVDSEFVHDIEEVLKILQLETKLVVFGQDVKGHTSFEEYLRATKEEIEAFEPMKLENNDTTAIIVFSSGSTGVPKGVCLSHSAILSSTSGYTFPVTFSPTSPVWISYALLLIRCLREGGATVLCKNFDIIHVWEIINRYKVVEHPTDEPDKISQGRYTQMFAKSYAGEAVVVMASLSVYHLFQMAEQPLVNVDISPLIVLVCTGAFLPPVLQSRLKRLMPNVNILPAYGLTEACGISLVFDLAKEEHRQWFINKPDSCGAPVPGFCYKIVDPETEEILGPNAPGELRVKAHYPILGYYKEDSSEMFDSDGYFKTGDIMRYDDERCFYFIDRLKEIWKFRGYKWSPTALENTLMSHPSVEMAAVIGIPSVKDGHLPMGIVKLKPNLSIDPDELVKYVDNMVDENKRLRAGVKILNNFPLTGTGKIHKRKLRDMILASKTL